MNRLGVIVALVFVAVAAGSYVAIAVGNLFWHRYQDTFTRQARFNLADMFMFMDPRRLFMLNVAGLIVAPLLVWLLSGNPVLAIALLVLLMFAPRKIYAWLKQRRILRVQSQLPDGLMMMASGMRAGLGVTPAMEAVAHDSEPPLAQELALVLRQQRMGVKFDAALANFHARVPIQDVSLVVSAIEVSRDVGGNLAETLATLSGTLRRRLIMENKIRSLTSQGRLQGIVMSMLPVMLIAALSLLYPDTMHSFYHSALGWVVIGIASVMEYLGYRMCKKIMAIDV